MGFMEKSIAMRDGRWFTVRIMPYRTHDERIDGVVITFADITVAKVLEGQLREKHAALEKLMSAPASKGAKAKTKQAPVQPQSGKP
jgi:two-component system CheB/CheR fusion protein